MLRRDFLPPIYNVVSADYDVIPMERLILRDVMHHSCVSFAKFIIYITSPERSRCRKDLLWGNYSLQSGERGASIAQICQCDDFRL